MKVSLRRKIVLGFSLALVLFGAIAIVAYRSTRSLIATAEGVAHTREVLETHGALQRDLVGAESGAIAHLLGEEGIFALAFDRARAQAIADAELLRGLVSDNPAQSDRLDLIQALITRQLATLGRAVEAHSDAPAVAAIIGGKEYQSRKRMLEKSLDGFKAKEQQLLLTRSDASRKTGRAATIVIVGGTLLTFLCLGAAGVIILRDIAARRHAEEALAREHNLLQNILNAIPARVFVQDAQGRYIVSNKANTEFLGLREESELENKTVFDLFPQELAALYQADNERVLNGESIFGSDEPSVDREGKLIWLDTTKVPLCDINGNKIGLVGISTDITQQKEADDRMRLFADQLERSNRALQDFASVASHDLQEPLR
ncbi:MAG: PAS domain-containing protein, partial [Verrucomicrobiota bacterium]|nr:PAS domain-containing protein [Verrucomicrobiota bacterium]